MSNTGGGAAAVSSAGGSSESESVGESSSSSKSNVTPTTSINSLSDLRNKAPQVYKFMMLSLAQNICISMKHDQDRLTAAMKKIREDY